MESNEVTTQKLVNDLKTVVQDAEELLRATTGEVSDKVRQARERLTSAVESARSSCQRLEERAREQARATDELVHKHPYESIGFAFGIGLLLGVIVGRK